MNFKNSKTVILGVLVLAAGLIWQLKPAGPAKKPTQAEEMLPAASERQPATQNSAADDVVTPALNDPSSKEELVKLIHDTKECYASETCDFPHSDPKSYEIAVGQKLKDLLNHSADTTMKVLYEKMEY